MAQQGSIFSFDEYEARIDVCAACGLYKGCKSPKMPCTGKGKMKTFILAEAPGMEEDKKNTQLIGDAGQLTREVLKDVGCSLDNDFWKRNAANCRPPKNRTPTGQELAYCRRHYIADIKRLGPKFVWLLGGCAISSYFMGKVKDFTIANWRGLAIPDREHNCWVFPMYHPSYILRLGTDRARNFFMQDIINAMKYWDKPKAFPDISFLKKVVLLRDMEDIRAVLRKIIDNKPTVAIDYETNRLNPYTSPDPKIVSYAICDGDKTYSFLHTNLIKSLWKKILADPEIEKVGQNAKYEMRWSKVIYNVDPAGWVWDTMVTRHILDSNNARTTGLNFQALTSFGIDPYDDEIARYKNSGPDGNNTMHLAPVAKLLTYGGWDAAITYHLYKLQQKEVKKTNFLDKGVDLFTQGTIALFHMEHEGINANIARYEKEERKLAKRLAILEEQIMSSDEAKLFKKHMRRSLGVKKDISTDDLRTLFYDIMEEVPLKQTGTGNAGALDEEVLLMMNTPFTKLVLEHRKLVKTLGTYLYQFKKEAYNGVIHPTFNLNVARSFRSSSSDPNFQNIPEHDEDTKKVARSGIVPRPGNKLLDGDYGALEVRGIACLSRDKVLIDYCCDPKSDMHKELAMEMFLLYADLVHKDIRFQGKNGFVFPEFYGSYYKSCASNIWKEIPKLRLTNGKPLLDHLKKKRIYDYDDFESHVKSVEDWFWNKFKGVKKWQLSNEKFYDSHFYIELVTGFRRYGLLSKNIINNTPVQGFCFHLLLTAIIKLVEEFKTWKSKVIVEVHDSLTVDLFPKEEKEAIKLIEYTMNKGMRREFPDLLIVPFPVEFSITEIDGSWCDKREIKL